MIKIFWFQKRCQSAVCFTVTVSMHKLELMKTESVSLTDIAHQKVRSR